MILFPRPVWFECDMSYSGSVFEPLILSWYVLEGAMEPLDHGPWLAVEG